MQIVEQPWARVRERVPVPDRATRVQLEALDDLEFSELLRSHLLPPNGDRDRWHALWAVLSGPPGPGTSEPCRCWGSSSL